MALTRPHIDLDPTFDPVIADDGTPAVTIVMSTRPSALLRRSDRRRLAELVVAVEGRLTRGPEPVASSTSTILRLLAGGAATGPASQGLALVANSGTGRHLTFDRPVMSQTIIGSPPSHEQLAEATWGLGRLAVLRLHTGGPQLVAGRGATVWTPQPPWDPVDGAPRSQGVLNEALSILEGALSTWAPIVLAGDDRLVQALRALDDLDRKIAAVLPGDHSETSNEVLFALAERAMRRSLDGEQRTAMAAVALSVDRNDAVRGVDAVARRGVEDRDLLVVELGALDELRRRAPAAGGAVPAPVTVPGGFLPDDDTVVLVPGQRGGCSPVGRGQLGRAITPA